MLFRRNKYIYIIIRSYTLSANKVMYVIMVKDILTYSAPRASHCCQWGVRKVEYNTGQFNLYPYKRKTIPSEIWLNELIRIDEIYNNCSCF